ncbi:MAG: lysophospholipase [Myxococcota bacterium]|nr:lysophospholipase [Myxococcota bacterium]
MRASFAFALLLVACGSDTSPVDGGVDTSVAPPDAGPPRDWPAAEPPATTEPEEGILRDVIVVDGVDAPPNPTTGDDTPRELDRFAVVRFRAEGVPEPRAIVLAMPGFLGGAGSWEMLARHLVRRSVAASAPIEVWAIDRRANLLEDRRGLDAAEALSEPDAARGYHFRGETVGGEAFDGFVEQQDVPFASEWGLATHVGDLHLLIARVPEAMRRGHVFLMGHSLGASFAETYAAWRFEDGSRGVDELAGVILIDGAQSETPATETEYAEGGGSGLMTMPGLTAIRERTRYFELPLLGSAVYARAEIVAMDALLDPDTVRDDRERDVVLGTLLSLPIARVPSLTNAAAFGFAFDDASNGLTFAAVSMGRHEGGPTETYDSLFGTVLSRPSDPTATYSWIDVAPADTAEFTPLENLARSWIDGRTNFAEWYFPARLPLDLSAAAGLAIAEDGWQVEHGVRALDGASMDAPVLAIAAGLRPVASYAASRARGAPIGAGRPNAGVDRTDERAYRIVDATVMTHIDPLTAADAPRNPVPPAIVDFVLANVADGTIAATLP